MTAYNEKSADEGNSAITNINQGETAPATNFSIGKDTTSSLNNNNLEEKITQSEAIEESTRFRITPEVRDIRPGESLTDYARAVVANG